MKQLKRVQPGPEQMPGIDNRIYDLPSEEYGFANDDG
jgi:hypothetical protein